MRNPRRKISWSDLPIELLRSIAKHLKNNPQNLHNFRSTCTKWRFATTISALLPHQMGSETLFSSSIFLLHPPSSNPPWIFTAVEITKGKFQLYHPLTGYPHKKIPDNIFSSVQFRSRRLAIDYQMAAITHNSKHSRPLRPLFWHDKVLIFYKNHDVPSMVDDCSLLVLFRGGQLGGSPPVKPEYRYGTELPWFDISYGSLNKFDDILNFRGVIYALDCVGKLYRMFTKQFSVLRIVVDKPVVEAEGGEIEWRKRLVGSSCGNLYLIRRDGIMVRVYKLFKRVVEKKKSWCWIKVESFGDDDMVLFVSRAYCFFVSAAEFPVCEFSNCVIFCDNAFNPCCKGAKPDGFEDEIKIFRLGEHDDGMFEGITSFPGSSVDVFTPPDWVLQAYTASSPSHCQSDPEENDMMKPVASSQNGASSHEHVSAPSSEEQNFKTPSTMAEQRKTTSSLPRSNDMHEEAPDILKKGASATESTHVIPPVPALKNCEPNIKFQGIDIKSNLSSTLQNVWNKHGSLVGENTVRSRDMLACALASLAKMIFILQNTTPRTLTDSLAKDLESILHDLQCVRLKVDWLVPFVQKALSLHKSKPHIESIMDIDKSIAQADKDEREFLTRNAKVKLELQERRACMSAKIPFPEPIDLDQCLGEGLF